MGWEQPKRYESLHEGEILCFEYQYKNIHIYGCFVQIKHADYYWFTLYKTNSYGLSTTIIKCRILNMINKVN